MFFLAHWFSMGDDAFDLRMFPINATSIRSVTSCTSAIGMLRRKAAVIMHIKPRRIGADTDVVQVAQQFSFLRRVRNSMHPLFDHCS